MTELTNERERAAFEAWYAPRHDAVDFTRRPGDDQYDDWDIALQWNAWQACAARRATPSFEGALPPVEYDKDMDRTYIPLPGGWEVQTKGKGSTFRIAHVQQRSRWQVLDDRLHEPLEALARDTRAALAERDAEIANLRAQLARQSQEPQADVIEHAARICESYCACDNDEDDEEVNRMLRNRASRIRGLLAAAPAHPVAQPEKQKLTLRSWYVPGQGAYYVSQRTIPEHLRDGAIPLYEVSHPVAQPAPSAGSQVHPDSALPSRPSPQ
jgi:hypothetical protein